MKNILKNENFLAVLLIALIAVLTHGWRIPWLGYYHDDWYLLWSGAARGAESIIPLFSTDRPFMGVVYSYVYRLLGDQVLNWHLYAWLWRFLGALAFYWIVRLLWPGQRSLAVLMTGLFLVYPGFLSQPDANTKQNHLFGFASALFSIALMLQAWRLRSRVWQVLCIALSALLTANYLFIYEYMIGFEGTRLAILAYTLGQTSLPRWRPWLLELLKRWWPYPLVTAGFLYWRIFLFDSSRNATDASRLAGDYLANIRSMSLRLSFETVKDFLDSTLFAWFVSPYHLIAGVEYSVLGKAALVALIVVCLVWAYLKWVAEPAREESLPALSRDFLWLGAWFVFCAVFPVVLSGRELELGDAYKSYGLHPIPGVVLFVTGVLVMLQPHMRKAALMVLLFISVTTHGLNIERWERFWQFERETWWQLTWRAPDIQDQTLMVVYFMDGYQLQQDYEIWGPVNLIYRPGPAKAPAIQAEVLTRETAYDILRGEVRDNRVRDIRVRRNFSQLLLVSLPTPNSCAHILDGSLPVYSESESYLVQQVGRFSRVDRIVTLGERPTPPSAIFGNEPVHGWCYYYQMASLARQKGDWKGVADLYDQVREKNLKPGDQSEWVPFFEGLVNAGRYDEAKEMFRQEFRGRERLRLPICQQLNATLGYPEGLGYDEEKVREILCGS